MFCRDCGKEVAGEFCGGCGAAAAGAPAPAAPQQKGGYGGPNYEFKTVKCYPDEGTEQRYVGFYQDMGWEVVDMDRKQTFDGQSYNAFDGSSTSHYSTSTYIKMKRDKNRPNYAQIAQLSAVAEDYFDTSPKKSKKTGAIVAIVIGVIAVLAGLANIGGIRYGGLPAVLVPGLVGVGLLVLGILLMVKGSKKDKALSESYYANKAEADRAYEECRRLVHG
jgi:hypothetical protein